MKNILKNGITIPSLKDMENCINRTREGVCHYYHPGCIFKATGNGYTYFSRKVCRESCISFYAECDQTFQFLLTSDRILRSYCPLFPVLRDMGKLPDCQEFLAKDIQKMEQCKLMETSGKSYELKYFRYCKYNENNQAEIYLLKVTIETAEQFVKSVLKFTVKKPE